MNWLNHLLINSALTCIALSPLMASSTVSSAFREEEEPLLVWSQGNKHFTTSFYPHAKNGEGNFIFSPVSLQLGLAMTSEIALNATQEEILEKGVLPANPSIRHWAAVQMMNQLNTGSATGEGPLHLSLANGAWLSSEIRFPLWFQTILTQSYKAALHQADFRSSAEETGDDINAWVEEMTAHQIQNLIPKGSLNSQTQLVLVNTLYMRARWKQPFEIESTYEDVFYGLEKSLRLIPYMYQIGRFGYLEDATCLVVEIPFQPAASTKNDLSLFVVLPKEDYSLEDVENNFSTRRLDHWMTDFETRQIHLSLPKFKVSTSMNAKEMFRNLGLHRPFSPQEAEFDLNGELGSVVITDIVHNAVFEVDEGGGKGSAGSGMIIGPTYFPEIAEVKVNRPFLIFVADKASGIVLFAGRIMQPKI